MEKQCMKCNLVKPLYSFIKTRNGGKGDVCYKCRYGVNSKKKPFVNFLEESERYKLILEKHIIKQDGCWEWTGSKNKHGYGEIRVNRKHLNASRGSWIAYKGEIPKGMYVLHTCDNRSCTNPDHLFLGTPKDNMLDMIKKGRASFIKGDNCPWAKINSTIVIDILENLKKGVSTNELSKKYNISVKYIGEIRRGSKWAHVGNREGLELKQFNKRLLNKDIVKAIKKLFNQGLTISEVARMFNLKRSTVDDIKKNRTWKHVTT